MVDGKPIAESVAVDSAYRYLRTYDNEIYSGVTGYFSVFRGATGIESAANSYLSGQSSSQFFEQVNAVLSGNPITGAAVELTLDPKLQQAAWDALGDYRGALIAIDPVTGNILAMVSKPGFNANRIAGHESEKVRENYAELEADAANPLINKTIGGDLYHPGSVFKLVVAAAALESGEYNNASTFPNPVSVKLPGSSSEVFNSSRRACGSDSTVSLIYAMRYSCNVPFVELGLALGQDRLRAQAELFGFGKEIRVPMLATPSVFPEEMDEAQLGLSSFGQFDVRATALQMAMVMASVGNSGRTMNPYLVQEIRGPDLSILQTTDPSQFADALKPSSSLSLTEMLVNVVENGTGSNARIPGVRVAGKTGTAQTGNDAPSVAWFVSFAPAAAPKVAVAVVIEESGAAEISGNGLAAPIAKAVMEAVLGR